MTYLQTSAVLHLYFAFALLPLALVFDILDGRIARWRKANSAMGRELDSLADVISFGVAPAVLAYGGFGMHGAVRPHRAGVFRRLRRIAAGALAILRKSSQKAATRSAISEGTPIPTSLLLVAVLAAGVWHGALGAEMVRHAVHRQLPVPPLVLMFAVSGSLMINRIRIPQAVIPMRGKHRFVGYASPAAANGYHANSAAIAAAGHRCGLLAPCRPAISLVASPRPQPARY